MSHLIWRQIKTAALSELNPEMLLAETSIIPPRRLCSACSMLVALGSPRTPPPPSASRLHPSTSTHPSTLFLFSFFPPPWFSFFFPLFACLIYFFPPHHHRIQRLIQYTCSIWSNLVNLNIPVKCNFKVSLATSTKSRPIHQGFN